MVHPKPLSSVGYTVLLCGGLRTVRQVGCVPRLDLVT